MLSAAELSELVESAQSSIFRLEAQPVYDVESQRGYLDAYLAGEELDLPRRQRWLDTLRARAARGINQRHLRVLRLPLSDYDRMACEWGYALNVQAGLEVRVRDFAGVETFDYYLLDDLTVVAMHYDQQGQFRGADPYHPGRTSEDWRRFSDGIWDHAEPFTEWWAAHPEYHRQVVAG